MSNGVYTSKEIGWSILIPNGWKIITKAQSDKFTQKGKAAAKDVYGVEIDDSEVNDLISFQKNIFNAFMSNSEHYKETYEG
ncbi:hypothetical protein [Kordia sp.]|uniref:hypothetical protein n=1 Tax=Kordia sp. TaxID=1965332 RepID=UPI0025B7D55A|nr:hypothetical protein [Kordia sp.]MCH2194333.1 hypothetical protein [Kordia sp.]